MTNRAAFFDLDRTLIAENSALLYVRYEYRHGRIGWHQLALSSFWMGLYHLNLLDIDAAYKKALQSYAGLPEAQLEARAKDFFFEQVHALLQPGAKRAIATHRQQQDHVVVLTNGSPYQAACAAEAWGLDAWLANDFATNDAGLLTGQLGGPLCYGEGKVIRAQQWAASRNIALADCTFYTDSYSDVPMLEVVGEPIVVNPDPKLARHAKQRGWQVQDWRLNAKAD